MLRGWRGRAPGPFDEARQLSLLHIFGLLGQSGQSRLSTLSFFDIFISRDENPTRVRAAG